MRSIITTFLILSTSVLSAQDLSKRDKYFAKCAAQGGLGEVKFGELTKTHANAQDVKTGGERMIEDHSKANAELKNIASAKHLNLPDVLSTKQEKKYRKIGLMSGDEFDKKFTRCMIKDHKYDVCLFKKESKKGKDSELKAFAAKEL